MFARLLALCCLLILAVSPGWTGGDRPSSPNLVVYLKTAAAQPAGPLTTMKAELDAIMRSAGFRVEWRDEGSANRNAESAELVVMELRGVCGVSGRAALPRTGLEGLASTAVSDGRVLPFSWVNCDALNGMLAPVVAGETPLQQDFLYGRAMARLLAHELYHVTARRREHGRSGLAKPGFTRRELLGDRFEFAPETVAEAGRNRVP